MGPQDILLVIQALQAAIAAAPQVEKAAVAGKNWVTSLFESGAISKAQQDKIHSHVDAVSAAVQAGSLPPEWTVEPDPV